MSDNQPTLTMASKSACEYCDKARAILTENGIPWEETKLDNEDERFAMYDALGLKDKKRVVPQFFINYDGESLHAGGSIMLKNEGFLYLFGIKPDTTLRTAVSFEVTADFVGVLAIEGSACCE